MHTLQTTKVSQLDWAKGQLKIKGYVSRNDALSQRITRLSALVHQLRKEGYNLKGGWQRTIFGNDYLYYLTDEGEEK